MEKPGVWVHLWMFCFVQIALWTVPCFSVDLGQACTSNENCTVANSTCVTDKCTCEASHYQLNATTCNERLAPGDGCTTGGSSDQCVGNATCPASGGSPTCECDSGFYKKDGQCSERIRVGQTCTGNATLGNCISTALCEADKTCRYKLNEACTPGSPNPCQEGAECTSSRCKIKAGSSLSCSNDGDCVPSAICEGNTCRYKLNEICTPATPGSANPCQDGAECANDGSFRCKIKAGSSLSCSDGDCVPSAVCEGNTCKTKLNQPCNATSPNCQANTTCVDDGQGGNKCRRDYGSSCTSVGECQGTKNEKCLSYDSSSQMKCLCSEQHFRLTSSNVCKDVSILVAENVKQTSEKMETTITIEWTKHSELTGDDAEYRVRAIGKNTDQWSPWNKSQLVTIFGLTPGEKYQVSVRTRTRKDPGYGTETVEQTTTNITAYTKPAKPGKLIPERYSAPNVTLKFFPSNGTVENYTVTVEGTTVEVGRDEQEANFTDLKADTTYTVTIKAISNNIMSDPQTDSFRIEAGRSGEVTELTVQSGSRWSEVSWRKPDQPNGKIMGYTVKLLTQEGCVSGVAILCSSCTYNASIPSTAGCSSSRNNTVQLDTAPQPFTVNVTGLRPDVEYTVRVNAYNQIGEGNPKDNLTRTEQEAAPTLKALTLSTPEARQILVSWTPAERTGPTSYTVTWKEKESLSSSNYNFKGNETISGYHNTSLTISTDLLSYWNYEVSVFPFTPVVNPPANTTTQIVMTKSTEPEAVNFTVIPLPNSAEKVNLTAQCPEEKNRNGPISSIFYQATVKVQGAYDKNAPSGSIDVSESQCRGSRILDVAAEAEYSFRVFAKTPSLDGKPSQKEIKISPVPPRLEKPSSVRGLVVPKENKSSSVVLEVCDCVVSPQQGRILLAGITACVKSTTETCLPKQGSQSSDYGSLPTWKQFISGEQKGRYRVTDDKFFKDVTPGTGAKLVPFTVGEDKTCEQEAKTTFCNGPLPQGREFVIIVWACTEAGCTESGGVPVKTLAVEESSSVGAIVGAVVAVAAIAVVAVVVVMVVLRRKKRACFSSYEHPETLPDITPVRNRATFVAKWWPSLLQRKHWRSPLHINYQSLQTDDTDFWPYRDGPDLTGYLGKPVKLRDFAAHLERLHKDSNLLFQEEFEDIQERSPKHFPQEAAVLDANKVKNRYVNILPFDHTRVKLTVDDDDDSSDFVNANYIPGYTSPREYIATQGPMVGTFSDFWKMLWEQKSSLIVMLSDLQEKGRPKVDMYWPGEMHSPVQYDDTVVELTSVSTLNKYTIRTFNVYKEDQKEDVRRVAQYFIPGWEDYSANLNPDDVLDFISSTRLEARSSQGPIIVHCSAGVGRTGTFIALDFLMQYVREHQMEDTVDIYNLVLNMRHNRPFMVQSEKQYIFIHDTLKVIIERKKREEEEHVYGNTCLEDIYVNQAFEPEENLYENTSSKPTTSL